MFCSTNGALNAAAAWKWLYLNPERPGQEGRALTGDGAALMMIKRWGVAQSSPLKGPNWSEWLLSQKGRTQM